VKRATDLLVLCLQRRLSVNSSSYTRLDTDIDTSARSNPDTMATSSSIESIVPDSTMGTSPMAVVFSPVTIKRPVRTYGRKRSPVMEEDPKTLSSSAFSRQEGSSRLRTAPPSLHETVGPSSDNDDEESEEEGDNGFGWREKMEAVDKFYDSDDAAKAMTTHSVSGRGDPPVTANDVFHSPGSARGSTRGREGLFLSDADSEDEHEFPKTSPTATTPETGHLSTPGDQSTPATTDPDAPSSHSSKREGKQRSLEQVRRSILPVISPSPSPNARRSGTKRKSALKVGIYVPPSHISPQRPLYRNRPRETGKKHSRNRRDSQVKERLASSRTRNLSSLSTICSKLCKFLSSSQ
jgi:hypothetical protein